MVSTISKPVTIDFSKMNTQKSPTTVGAVTTKMLPSPSAFYSDKSAQSMISKQLTDSRSVLNKATQGSISQVSVMPSNIKQKLQSDLDKTSIITPSKSKLKIAESKDSAGIDKFQTGLDPIQAKESIFDKVTLREKETIQTVQNTIEKVTDFKLPDFSGFGDSLKTIAFIGLGILGVGLLINITRR